MVYCTKCGAKNEENVNFCVNCGEQLYPKINRVKRETGCFGENERSIDFLGIVSFGIFILIFGIIFAANPNLVSDFRLWIEQLINEKVLLRPPKNLITSAVLFFGLMGSSNFFIGSIRLSSNKNWRKFISDIITGVALIFFAYLIYLYGVYSLTWQMVFAIEAIVCGILVIIYSIVRLQFL